MKIFSLMFIQNNVICMNFEQSGVMETNVNPASVHKAVITNTVVR
jgi:hypothetical protein